MKSQAFLILDDSPADRRIIGHVLQDAFPLAEISQAGDAAAARVLCAATTFDCILLDYNLPQMDGVAFAEELRAACRNLPIVLVTGMGDEMLVSHALRRGVTDYIPKSRVNVESMRRIVERAIHSCEQMRIIQAQSEELENFGYALAHDFKQPIRQIRTFTELVSQEVPNGDSESLQSYLGFLSQAALRLGNLVDVMSQYTLLNQEPELKTVAFADVIDNVTGALGLDLIDRGAVLQVEGEASLHGNETLLSQVLQNLIVNGVKYNRCDIPRVDVRVEALESECLITVHDNGIGMEEKYLAEIFHPLVRLHTAAEYAGTGLGLTLARKAIMAQHGTIWCESELGVGSTFFVRMPLAHPESGPAAVQL